MYAAFRVIGLGDVALFNLNVSRRACNGRVPEEEVLGTAFIILAAYIVDILLSELHYSAFITPITIPIV